MPQKNRDAYTATGYVPRVQQAVAAADVAALSMAACLASGPGPSLVFVAAPRLRLAYLGVLPGHEMSSICMCVLEAIGRGGADGTEGIVVGRAVAQSPKNVFTHVNRLETFQLVRRDARTHVRHRGAGNRLWLSRFQPVDDCDAAAHRWLVAPDLAARAFAPAAALGALALPVHAPAASAADHGVGSGDRRRRRPGEAVKPERGRAAADAAAAHEAEEEDQEEEEGGEEDSDDGEHENESGSGLDGAAPRLASRAAAAALRSRAIRWSYMRCSYMR